MKSPCKCRLASCVLLVIVAQTCLMFVFYFGNRLVICLQRAGCRAQPQTYQYDYADCTKHGHGQTTGCSQAPSTEPAHHIVARINNEPVLVLYSARFDITLESVVLIGFFKLNNQSAPSVNCLLDGTSTWQQARSHGMHEGHDRPYDGVLYFCPAKDWKPSQPATVSITVQYASRHMASGSVTLPVQISTATGAGSSLHPGAAACITALRYIPSQEPEVRFILRLVEFIEVNRLLGVEHFYFYNWSLPADTSRTLRHYIGLGWVSVSQWSLPAEIRPEDDIHYFGQMPMTNDCLYAARDQYRLVAFIDIDEFLVPLGGSAGTLIEAARVHGLQDRGAGFCALGFRHGLFPLMSDTQLMNGSNWGRLPPGLKGCRVTSLLYDRRAKKVMPFTERSKLLVVARQIKEMGIHFAWDTWSGCQTKQLNPDSEGLLHHLRSWSPVELVEDVSMRRHEKSVEAAMIGARLRLKQMLGIDICE